MATAMTLDDLLAAVATEPERIVTREIRAPSPALLSGAGGMLLTDFLAALPERGEMKTRTYQHVLEPGATEEIIAAWEAEHPDWRLPADLRVLLRRVNGIHLWADAETRRAYTGLAPLREWRSARVAMYGASADHALLDDHYLAISYHQDGGAYDVLDVRDGRYFLMDPAGPDRTCMIASCVPELLGRLWRMRLAPSD